METVQEIGSAVDTKPNDEWDSDGWDGIEILKFKQTCNVILAATFGVGEFVMEVSSHNIRLNFMY